ncbi:hydroxyacylglutathione hydrolase-like protein isoform X3 [Tiliqua scincoides]|uniref:hydroxyacylglutathione hydrolase-like protein isoform X3 n=1 Tax=Tiliqua scincoides TaxID=71010 RepID=UPI003462667B
MKVKVISILEDNYMYLIIEESTQQAVAVDAAVSKRLLEIIQKEGATLKAILTTHHHWDHARGNEELARLFPGLEVYGGDKRVGALTHPVTHNEELKFGSINVRCLLTPGHTMDHVCYFVWEDNSPDAPAAFTGDALFIGGCGKILEGTAEQMYKSLTEVLGTLPMDAQREEEDLPTVPSTLAEEFLYNPFLRVSEEAVQKFTGKADPVEVFAALCKARNSFRKPKERLNPQAMLAFEWGLFDPLLAKK